MTSLRAHGLTAEEMKDVLGGMPLDVRPLTTAQTYAIGHLPPATRTLGLSLGDRACLALAADLGAPALTTDQTWAGLNVGAEVEPIRG